MKCVGTGSENRDSTTEDTAQRTDFEYGPENRRKTAENRVILQQVMQKITDWWLNKTKLNDRCRRVKATCLDICSDSAIPTNDYGFKFWNCVNSCLAASGCL